MTEEVQHDPNEFPKMLYHKGNVDQQKVVNSQEEEDALGADWHDRPHDGADVE